MHLYPLTVDECHHFKEVSKLSNLTISTPSFLYDDIIEVYWIQHGITLFTIKKNRLKFEGTIIQNN